MMKSSEVSGTDGGLDMKVSARYLDDLRQDCDAN